jgi:pimeloyl-ACP methyl ester carboxylesterase
MAQSAQPPLLFIHGAWHGAWCWEEYFLPYFRKLGYQASAIDLPLHGAAKTTGAGIRWLPIGRYVEAVHTAIARFEAPPVLIGHSMGGHVVQKVLEAQSLPAAILLASNPPGHGAWMATLRAMRLHPLAMLRLNLKLEMYEAIRHFEDAKSNFFSTTMPAEQAQRYHQQMGGESFLAYLGLLGLARVRPQRIRTPLLVLGAAEDRIFAPWEVRRTARTYGAECHIFPNMAHDMMLESDWQIVASYMHHWLAARGL